VFAFNLRGGSSIARLDEAIDARFRDLLSREFHHGPGEYDYWVGEQSVSDAHAWLVAAGSLIGVVTNRRGVHWDQAERVLTMDELRGGVPMDAIRRMNGILAAAYDDWKGGLLSEVQYAIYAETFDDFLDFANEFHRSGKVQESAILAAAVLEDTLKKIARRYEVDPDRSLDPLIDDLVRANVFTPVQGKRVKAWAGVRNDAFHARWDRLDLQSVGEAIRGIRELIDSHLQ
jgi:uncharacterized protein YutE (UPF0331/DUF86 family)